MLYVKLSTLFDRLLSTNRTFSVRVDGVLSQKRTITVLVSGKRHWIPTSSSRCTTTMCRSCWEWNCQCLLSTHQITLSVGMRIIQFGDYNTTLTLMLTGPVSVMLQSTRPSSCKSPLPFPISKRELGVRPLDASMRRPARKFYSRVARNNIHPLITRQLEYCPELSDS